MNFLKKKIKSVLTLFHFHKKTKPDVFIFTLPRAGSTLLAQVLNTTPNSKSAHEPLLISAQNEEVLNKYIGSNNIAERYIDISESLFIRIINYLKTLSKGTHYNGFIWNDFSSLNHNFNTKYTFFKIHKLTYYFEEILNKFNDDYGLYLLRHPISHSYSRARNNWSDYISDYSKSKKISPKLSDIQNVKIKEVLSCGSKLEKLVLSWVLENYLFIEKLNNNKLPKKIIPVFYEELVNEPKACINKIYTHINIDTPKKAIKSVRIPSKGVIHSTKNTIKDIKSNDKLNLLEKWMTNISKRELENCQEILDTFNINIYSIKSPLPLLR